MQLLKKVELCVAYIIMAVGTYFFKFISKIPISEAVAVSDFINSKVSNEYVF